MNLNVAVIMSPGDERDSLVDHLTARECAARVADTPAQYLGRYGNEGCEIGLLDFGPGTPGLPGSIAQALEQKRESIQRLKDNWPKLQLVVFADRDSQATTETLELGVRNIFRSPINYPQLDGLLNAAGRSVAQQARQQRETARIEQEFRFDRIVGQSPAVLESVDLARRVSQSSATSVLILGESGVGKELFARAIHGESPRKQGPFMEVNCAAIPRELLESELFGHEKGAFTDARQQKQGLLELANGGTLFLDEVGEMSLTIQVKVLRVLERMTFKRVGGTKDITVSVRVISATNQNLETMVREQRFREDLFYRLKVVPIRVPPLRERREDILPLAHHFLAQFNRQFGKSFASIEPAAEQILVSYPWPGNIRELRNLFERIVLLSQGTRIQTQHLTAAISPAPSRTDVSSLSMLRGILEAGQIPEGGFDLEGTLGGIERDIIRRALDRSGGNQSKTAEILQMKRDKLRYRMKLYGFQDQPAADVG